MVDKHLNARSWVRRYGLLDRLWKESFEHALPVARMYVSDGHEVVRSLALDVLAEAADRADRFRVEERLGDKAWVVRHSAVFCVVEIRKEEAIEPVLHLLKTDRVPAVRAASALALGSLSPQLVLGLLE